MSSDVVIDVQNLHKVYRIYSKPEDRLVQMASMGRVRRYQEFSAVKNVSLQIKRGETVGIIGRNGCGKSTLLQMIVGTLQPTAGTVNVQGRIAALLELGAGFNGEFTGRENVYMNGAILGFSREEMDARFDAIAAFAGIGDFIERPVKTYSSGMFVRLAFAVSTAVEPDILVVDEALSVGDEAFQRKCFARIEAIKERGGTILFVSHGAQTIVQLCDRAILLDGGEKLLEGEPKLVVGQYQRLVNASDEGATTIKADILAMGGIARAAAVDEVATAAIVGTVAEPAVEDEDDGLADYFDSNLKSDSAIEIGGEIAAITDFSIKTASGKIVNHLNIGKEYSIFYSVKFIRDCDDVSFGYSLKTVQGYHLSGASSRFYLAERKTYLADEVGVIKIDFVCRLLPSVYFLTFGVGGKSNSTDDLIFHRVIDATCFRVVDSHEIQANGIVDLDLDMQLA